MLGAQAASAIIPMKARRQALVLELVQREPVRSQEQLRRRVRAAGFDVTQATLSRDIRELGLVKGGAAGAYQAAPLPSSNGRAAALLHRALADYLTRIDRVQQLVLLRTGPGQAPLLGVAIDGARFPEVVGTLAGDDTILAVAPDARRARALVRKLQELSAAPAER
jgi:transcriptional regulator of arginine metabolism